MHRIDTATAQQNKFGAGKHGWTNGDLGTGAAATDSDDDWFDAVQEELATVIEQAGIVLAKGTNTQLRAAILSMLQGATTYVQPSELRFDVNNDAGAIARKIFYRTPALGQRTLIEEIEWSRSIMCFRRYVALNTQGAVSMPAYEWTFNARWDGAQWNRDEATFSSYKFTIGPWMQLSYAVGATWTTWVDALTFDGSSFATYPNVRHTTLSPFEVQTSAAHGFVMGGLQLQASGAQYFWPLSLPQGAVLEEVTALVNPGAGTMTMAVYAIPYLTGTTPVPQALGSGATTTGTDHQALTAAPGATIDNVANTYVAMITANGSAATDFDMVHMLRLRWTDPGPRNH